MDVILTMDEILTENPTLIATIAGLLGTIITSLAARNSWTSEDKRWFAIGLVALLTTIGIVVSYWPFTFGDLIDHWPIQWDQVAALYAVAVGVAQAAYTVLESLGIDDWLKDTLVARKLQKEPKE